MIYLDHAATTPVLPAVAAAMADCLRSPLGNASALHEPGEAARALVEQARVQVAALLDAKASELVFTSGATESDNLALQGVFHPAGGHLVTSRIEHRAVLDTARQLQSRGVGVSLVTSDRGGRVEADRVAAVLRPDTRLVSIMLANNETGVLQDLPAIVALCRARGVLVHTDAAQVVGHLPVSVRQLDVDLLSLSAHKMGGPSGIGALWVGDRARSLRPILYGGGQENGLRPGTLPVHQIAGMGEACRVVAGDLVAEAQRQRALCARLLGRLTALGGVSRNGTGDHAVPHILNLRFEGVDGEALHASLPGLAVSGGSACGAERGEPSYVLRALGLADAQAEASVRFSFGRENTDKDIEEAAKIVEKAVIRLRGMSPV